jgi:hypothetical protein
MYLSFFCRAASVDVIGARTPGDSPLAGAYA